MNPLQVETMPHPPKISLRAAGGAARRAVARLGTRRDRSRSRGQSLVELALVTPILMLVLTMTIDFGRLFYSYIAVANAAKEGAQYGALNPLCADHSDPSLCPDPQNATARTLAEAPDLGGLQVVTVQCRAADGTPRAAFRECVAGDIYRVATSYPFRFLTPIIGNLFGGTMNLRSASEALVVNQAFDPTPGLAVSVLSCFGSGCTPALSPTKDTDNNTVYVKGYSGDPMTYQFTLTNIGGTGLSGVTATITQGWDGSPQAAISCTPTLPSVLAVGQAATCTASGTAPGTNGQPLRLWNTSITGNATGLSQSVQNRTRLNQVQILASPSDLWTRKYVSPYKLGGSGNGTNNDGTGFGTLNYIEIYRNAKIPTPRVWYRVTVSNEGGLDAAGVTISDNTYSLASTADCPARPALIAYKGGNGSAWTCLYQVPFSATGPDVVNTVTASASPTDATNFPDSASATVRFRDCAAPNMVVPMLVGLGESAASSAWTAAGFTTSLTVTGNGSGNLKTQSEQAFSCVAPTTPMGVTK